MKGKYLMKCPKSGEAGCDWANCSHLKPHLPNATCKGEHVCGGVVYTIFTTPFKCSCQETTILVPLRESIPKVNKKRKKENENDEISSLLEELNSIREE
jgi:hypothetical protein